MTWSSHEDVFTFAANFRSDLQPLLWEELRPTKRQVLQVVMNLFDPLGIVSSYTIHGKIMIQDIWRSKIDWDEAILDEEYKQWQRWISLTANLDHVRIPRCYFPLYNPGSYDELQLHVFVDASELAYCAVAYFRIVDSNGPRCVLVSAKSKVTPLRPQSIPRNELCAAVIGTRLSNTIDDNHSLKITQKFFWSDSSTVLSWLQSDPRNYRQFVGFRVAVLSSTLPSEWKWEPSSLNIADNATKWGNGPSFQPDSPWFKGPEVLYRSPEE